MRKALLTWALKDRNVWENTFLGKASVLFPGGLFLCAGCSSSNALFSVSLLNSVSRYKCSVTLWALKWTWVMMEVDKKYSSSVGPGGGVGFRLSLWCSTLFIWGLQCAVPEIPWGKTRPVPALCGVSFPRLELGYPPSQVGSGLLLSVTTAFVSPVATARSLGSEAVWFAPWNWEVQDCRWVQTPGSGWRCLCLPLRLWFVVPHLQQHLPCVSSSQPGHPSSVRLLGKKECEWKRQVKS